jgi:hypothetical protein
MNSNYYDKQRLIDFSRNVYSQNGEDGILEKIFELIGVTAKTCIEFGAWDGFHLSNTANLWTNGWKAVLIEGLESRYKDLKKNVSDYDCICLNAFVTRTGKSSLESILEMNGISFDIDLLSIDIDGDDYYVLESLEKLKPRVIVCEHNPTIPATADIYAAYGSNFGASVGALTRLAETKGYLLVALTETNCIFVLDTLANHFVDFEKRIEFLRSDRQLIYLVTNYAGDYVIYGQPPYGIGTPYRGGLLGLDVAGQFPVGTARLWRMRAIRGLKTLAKKVLCIKK